MHRCCQRNSNALLALVITLFVFAFACGPRSPAAEPIRLHPENPHYFLWREKPSVLITSGEHYGAVLNLDFNYQRYLDVLATNRFNLTRIFSGTYREVPGSFNITGNTLAPAPGRFICPWPRSPIPGATDGGNKFDLSRWDEKYFARLKDFLYAARQRGIIVELVLFCTMYDDAVWNASPMNSRNNTLGLGNVGKYEVFSGQDAALQSVQQALVEKLVRELNEFDNLYFEICNEPYERGGLTRRWNDRIIDTIVATEESLPNKHLIAQGFPPSPDSVQDLHPAISVLNFHAAKPEAVQRNFNLRKAIAFDETGGSDQSDRKYRSEGWRFMLAGGAVYNHLDFSFTTDRPDGSAIPLPKGGGGPELRRQLRILKEFIERFDFVKMSLDHSVIKAARFRGVPPSIGGGNDVRVLSKPGEAYAIYVNVGTGVEMDLELPRGHYRSAWINPRTGVVEQNNDFHCLNGNQTLRSPDYLEDIALRVTRVKP
jgi:hypothetical protein